MDKSTIIGIILSIIAISAGMVLKGVSLVALINPAALLIIFLGTAAAVLIAFPMSTIKRIPALFKILFKETKAHDFNQLIQIFTELADFTRREGLLALEQRIDEIDDLFLKSGLQLTIDGQTPDFIRDVLIEKIDAMEYRHQKGAAIFTQAGTYAPTLGVLGAVIGLIAALGNMNDTEALGHAISAAFIATLFGIFSGYVLWHPFANKLKEKSKSEIQYKYVMIEGVLSVTEGESPLVVKDKLSAYLSPSELVKLNKNEGAEQEDIDEKKETAG
ncbi:flagellar motor stator protein MotA [Halobacillus amylolyticus]|uniref:Flagellar motor stator protein MotA n=1 Tax=Halobacillus amylolyticus TaxID=2932259 RepID=A0ABY4H7G4_9BACI|nr:flagellar motor stator protein MotA [Halobacillus amylolyticus]UOR10534.1 flagellar motor stator protein MotA [Halobacillus amylolyticus]